MVRQSPVTLRRVVVAFFVLTVVALLPMAVLFVASGDATASPGYGGPALITSLIVVSVAVTVVVAVVVSTTRSLRLARA